MQTEWQRSSPVAGIHFLIKNLRTMVNFWPALAGVLAIEDWRGLFFVMGIPALILLLIVLSGIQWWFFGFQYDNGRVQLRSGVLNRRRLTLDFDRVQEVNLEQALYFRLFGLWSLDLESAGSKSKEVQIPGLPQSLAEDIRRRFLAYKRNVTADTAETAAANEENDVPAQADYQLSLDVAELVRFGLMHNTLIYIVPVLGAFISQSDQLLQAAANWLRQLPVLQWLFDAASTQGVATLVLMAGGIALVSLAILYALSILLAIAKYWRYTLRVEGERFQYRAGLFHRVSRGFKLHKMQCVIVKQCPIARLLKRFSLEIQQANEQTGSDQGGSSGFIVPVVDQAELVRIKALTGIEEHQWQTTKPIRILWSTLGFGTVTALGVAGAALATSAFAAWYGLLAYPLFGPLFWGRWRKTRYYVGEDWMAVQTGLIGFRTIYVPTIKVQKLQLAEGPFLRLHRAAMLTVWSGSKSVSIGFTAKQALVQARDLLLHRVGTHRGRWM